jgi:hypothetical protein
MLRNWNGELRLLQNFKLKRFNRKDLQHLASCCKKNQEELVTDDDDIEARNSVSVETPMAQITERDPQNNDKADISEGAVSLESKKLEVTDVDCMDIGSE